MRYNFISTLNLVIFFIKMLHLNTLDLLVYIGFIGFIGSVAFSSKLKANTILQFLVAGRSLPLNLFIASFVSCWYGDTLGLGEAIYKFGASAFALFLLPYYFFAFISAIFLSKKIREAKEITIPERLNNKFGAKVGLFSGVLVFLISLPAANLLMLASLIQVFTGWSLILNLIVCSIACCLFVYSGGSFADARVSLISTLFIIIGLAAISYNCLAHKHPLDVYHSLDKSYFDFNAGTGFWGYISFFLMGSWTLVDPSYHQKISSAQDSKTGQKGMLISLGICAIIDLMILMVCLYAVTMIKTPLENPLGLLPFIGNQMLPDGLRALFFCGVIGAILTDAITNMRVNGATLGRELMGNIWKHQSELKLLNWSRVGIFISTCFAVALALLMPSAISLWYGWTGCLVGSLLLPILVSYINFKKFCIQSQTLLIAMVLSFITGITWLIYCNINNNPHLEITLWNGEYISIGTIIPSLLVSFFVAIIGLIYQRKTTIDLPISIQIPDKDLIRQRSFLK